MSLDDSPKFFAKVSKTGLLADWLACRQAGAKVRNFKNFMLEIFNIL